MPEIILYHGSDHEVRKPTYGLGNSHSDYGLGFYCTQDINLAKEWAVDDGRDGYVNIYKLDLDGLNILNLEDERYSVLHWMTMLATYRADNPTGMDAENGKEWLKSNFSLSTDEFDIIRGYRADDGYYEIARHFLISRLPVQGLKLALRLGDWGEQIVLVSKKAFSHIRYIGNIEVDSAVYFAKRRNRNETAVSRYYNEILGIRWPDDLRLSDLLLGRATRDDPRLWGR